jgi:hypothetical protein
LTTTLNWLESKDAAEVAMVVVFDGLPIALTTASSASEMATAWAGTDWSSSTQWSLGLRVVGNMSQRITPYDPQIEANSLDIYALDVDDNLAAYLLRTAYSSGAATPITSDIDCNDTTFNVKTTTSFDSSGTLYLGSQETVTYSGKTATTFTGVTRGKYALFQTDGGSAFARPFRGNSSDNGTDVTAYKPSVSNYPSSNVNRCVAVYLHHRENGVWCTKANAQLLWAGKIKEISEDGTGNVKMSCVSVLEMLFQKIWERPYTARLAEGMSFTNITGHIHAESGTYTIGDIVTGIRGPSDSALIVSGNEITHRRLASEINNQMATWLATGTDLHGSAFSIRLMPAADGDGVPKYRMTWRLSDGSITKRYMVHVGLSWDAWSLLGWEPSRSDHKISIDGSEIVYKTFIRRTTTTYILEATNPPMRWKPIGVHLGSGRHTVVCDLNSEQGTWRTQTNLPIAVDNIYDGTTSGLGFIKVGESHVFAALYDDAEFSIVDDVTAEMASLGFKLASGPNDLNHQDTGNTQAVEAQQVWIEQDSAVNVFKRILMSTGTSGFNHVTHDSYADDMGIGIPASLIDQGSMLALGRYDYGLVLTGPMEVRKMLESIMAFNGVYLVWKNGKITFQRPAGTQTVDYQLTEANKALTDPNDAGRSRAVISADEIINVATMNYHYRADGKFRDQITVQDDSSITLFGQRRSVEIDAYGIYNSFIRWTNSNIAEIWRQRIAPGMMAHFTRPLAIISRTYDFSLANMAPGDVVEVTDQAIVNPLTGTRGITEMRGWVLSTDFDFSTGVGKCQIVLLPHIAETRIAKWAPSARVSSYDAGTKVLSMVAHEYSLSSDTVDAGRFATGDKARLSELGPSGAATNYTGLAVASVSTSGDGSVTLTTDPTGGSGLGAGRTYVLEYDDVLTVNSDQRAKAFIADDADMSTGYNGNDAYVWGPANNGLDPGSVDYTQQYMKVESTQDDVGTALSAHKLKHIVDSCNNLFAYRTSQVHINDVLVTGRAQTGTTEKLVYGPVWVPLYGGDRSLKASVYGKTSSGTGTFTVYYSPRPPVGSTSTSVSADSAKSVTLTTTSATYEWIAETSVTNPWRTNNPLRGGCWVYVTAKASAGGVTATFCGIHLREGVL